MGLIKRLHRAIPAQPATPIIYATDDLPILSYVGPQSLGIGPGEMIIGTQGNRLLWGNMGTFIKTFASWVPGSSVGGRVSPAAFSGTQSIYVFAIGNGEDSDVAIDSSPVGANIPTGWNWRRMIGAFLLSDGNLRDFYQDKPGICEYKAPVVEIAGANYAANSVNLYTLSVPALSLDVDIAVGVVPLSSNDARAFMSRLSQSPAYSSQWAKSGVIDSNQSWGIHRLTAENRQVKQRISSNNGQSIFINTLGYHVHL